MADLSNIFGGDDSTSSNDGSVGTGTVSDATSAADFGASSAQSSESADDDGSSSSDSNATDVGAGTSTDGLLGSMGDATGSSDEASS